MMKVAILGPGLLGGSIALALRERGSAEIRAWARREEAVAAVRQAGVADLASTDLRPVVEGADLVILCTPIGAMRGLASELVPLIAPSAVVTDVGSVKASVVAELGPIFRGPGPRFIGSHPMAGSEQTGLAAARADLFQGSVCIVTPHVHADADAVQIVSDFWRSLGCAVSTLSPLEHDRAVALVSHLPHLLAATLVQVIAAEDASLFRYAGPGFRDTTRVAGGAPEMWTEILQTNRKAVRDSVQAMIEKLREIVTLLDRDAPDRDTRMNHFLTAAKAHRDGLRLPP